MVGIDFWSHRAKQVAFLFLVAVLLAIAGPLSAAQVNLAPIDLLQGYQNNIGIDYNQRTGNLVATTDYNEGSEVAEVDRVNGVNLRIPGFTGTDELKVATVRQVQGACSQQWPVGTIFTGNGIPGQIVKLEPQANGTYIVSNPWVTLSNETIFRGGFFHDRWCVAGGDLIVVSGNGIQPTAPGSGGGNVYRINTSGASTFLKHIDNPAGNPAHLEGVITVPNNAAYGPWAGKIVTGDEDRIYTGPFDGVPGPNGTRVTHGVTPKIYAIDPSTGVCTQNSEDSLSGSCAAGFNFGGAAVPHPEDFDFVEGDFYGVAFNENENATGGGQGHIYRAGAGDFFANNPNPLTPDILITQEYPIDQFLYGPVVDVGTRSGLYQVRFSGGSTFSALEVPRTPGNCAGAPGVTCLAQWEHITFVPPSDVTIVKSPDGNSFNVGQDIFFDILVTSTGTGTATNVMITDPLPTPGNLTTWQVVSVAPTGLITPAPTDASCSITSGNQLSCTLGSMAPGATVTVRVSTNTSGLGANLAACTANGGRVDNTATVTADPSISKSDPGFWLCTLPGSYTLTKNPKNATYNIGDNINFTMVVTSTGPGTANNVVLNDPLPTLGSLSTWIISSDPTGLCTIASNTLNCPFGNLANGQSRTVTVATNAVGGANVAACPGGQKLNNTATLTGTGLPTKTDTGDYICTPPGSYTLTKNPKNATYNIGDNINFTMVVTSTGPGTANNVVLNDPLPTLGSLSTWIISSDPTGLCTIVSNTLNCAFGNLANGQSRTVTVATNAAGGANAAACPGGVKLNNTATLTGTGLPTKTDTGDYICTPPGSYTLTKNPKNATYNIGDNINFTMVVTSTGPGTANNVVLNDPLPTLGNLNTWTITTNPGGVCTIVSNTLNCPFGNLANGQTRTVVVATNAAGGANAAACPGGVKLNNTATLTGTGLPTKTDTGDYICTPPGSYTLTKNPKNATYNIGDNINFTMVVTSTGPGTANNVVLNDPLPTLGNLNTWTITTNPGGVCTIVSNTLNCPFGNLANGQTRTVVVATNAAGGANAAACPGGVKLNNTATLTGTGLPTKTDTGDYLCQPPSITIAKTPDNGTFNVGDTLKFTIVVTSGGPGTAHNVVLSDPLPTKGGLLNWTFDTGGNPGNVCTIVSNAVNCPFGDLASGQSRTVVVKTTTGAPAGACDGNKITNTATVTTKDAGTKYDNGDYTCTVCVPATFVFTGNTASTGTAGNIRTFTVNGISVKASAFSRVNGANGAWANAYLGLYGPGLGVTDSSESGNDPTHKVDNIGGRNNYVLFEFSKPVVIDRVFLDAIGADSDMSVWIGTKTDPFNNHLTLNDALLSSLGFHEDNLTSATVTSRWADINGANVSGNVLVIAAWDADDTPEDAFKISKLDITCGATSCPATSGNFDFSGSTSTTGTAGNIRTFTVNGVSVKASAFSRVDSNQAWSTAYLGLYGPGLGVTDSSESGNNPTHKVDNIGGRHNFVLFEFSAPIVVDQVFLDSIGADSDMSVWIGTKTDPFNNHLTLSNALLSSLFTEDNNTSASVTSRWANINGGNLSGNVLVIAASVSDTTPDDEFKVGNVLFKCK